MRYLRLTYHFARVSAQQELAYRANFGISLLHALLNLATGVLGLAILFGPTGSVQGWDFPAALALLGVYLTLGALRGLVFGPSLESLAGLEGEVWTGQFDFTLLRPADTQFIASIRRWRPLALVDLLLGLGTLAAAVSQLGQTLTPAHVAAFVITLAAGVAILYAMLLACAGLVFWAPGFLFSWVFDGIMQMARYPVGFYPGWLRLVLTWIIPVGIITTVPAQALTGRLSTGYLAASLLMAIILVAAASLVFRIGLRRYASASS
jgi:ABC-2 type transport system permease protein